ncbi:helix-turn-helix transcriptional regulator [Streptomyces sp. M2CJ-2]|uniref:helix-turn-helix domain-containing protein n=1 Tax=Streptomyces sp. M2CJ-2 TaxID=2803948 RepID=UPI001920F1DB|nr:helix-turn-helix transcriptional regulator [Streptomyces sp. M2CJ-2]MBL3665636.1 helix-turn-helix transcriptional regulator [Streptomyces sp. M2CJ-2]
MAFEFDPDALRRIRRERGVTQQKLADMVGRDVTTVSQYERGRYGLSVGTLAAIARALNAPMDAFIKAADDRELVSA